MKQNCTIRCTCLLQGVFEKSFAKIPDEPPNPGPAKAAAFGKSDSTDGRATRLADLQEQVGAEQVCFYTDGSSLFQLGHKYFDIGWLSVIFPLRCRGNGRKGEIDALSFLGEDML